MKIGIGITTTGKREIRYERYSGMSTAAANGHRVEMYVYVDEKREGPARAKNRTMKVLHDMGCDAMFLFDDDCYPMHTGWDQYVLEQQRISGLPFFGLPESFKSNMKWFEPGAKEETWWDGVIGCFIFQTREVMDEVGYYNTAYVGYGYEDAARNHRIRQRFFPGPSFPSLLRIPSYIHSEDVYAQNPTPNLTMAEKMAFIEKNGDAFSKEMHSDQLYYPFG